jgi:hypothetical protein
MELKFLRAGFTKHSVPALEQEKDCVPSVFAVTPGLKQLPLSQLPKQGNQPLTCYGKKATLQRRPSQAKGSDKCRSGE